MKTLSTIIVNFVTVEKASSLTNNETKYVHIYKHHTNTTGNYREA